MHHPNPGDHRPREEEELPLDENFIEQAEYIGEERFLALSASHPDEESIIRRLSGGGAKLLVGPRGCGKTTLMLKVYYALIRAEAATTLPIYVNFKLSLKLEPLYVNTPNATYWFRLWLNLKILEGLYRALEDSGRTHPRLPELISCAAARNWIDEIEAGKLASNVSASAYSTDALAESIAAILEANNLNRCVLLLDDAAHAFSPRQQEDFFEFFRQIKRKEISPKAAIYPGITTHSPTFHVGHDAEQIDMWVRPDAGSYLPFMRSLAAKRFDGTLPATLANSSTALDFLAYAAFGIPRSFLNMLREVYHQETRGSPGTLVDRRKLLIIAGEGRELSRNVYDSLEYKLPSYKQFVATGSNIYDQLVSQLKIFNSSRAEDDQGFQVGIKRPLTPEIERVLGFLQYAGLLLAAGENSRGIKGVFELYTLHFGELIAANAIVGKRTKSIPAFVNAFQAQTHQAWPRVSPETLVPRESYDSFFRLALPHCQRCGTERANEHSKFCHHCGTQLKTTSLYNELINQDISALPLSRKLIKRIKENSSLQTIKDVLLDSEKTKLRNIPWIGPIRAEQIARRAAEHVA